MVVGEESGERTLGEGTSSRRGEAEVGGEAALERIKSRTGNPVAFNDHPRKGKGH